MVESESDEEGMDAEMLVDSGDEGSASPSPALSKASLQEPFSDRTMLEQIKILGADNDKLREVNLDQQRQIASLTEQVKNLTAAIKTLQRTLQERLPAPKATASTPKEWPRLAPPKTTPPTPPAETQAAANNKNAKSQKRKKPTSGDSSEEDTAKTARTGATPSPKVDKIPPVVLRNKDRWQQISGLIKQNGVNFLKAKLLADGVAVTPTTADNHRKMTRILRTNGEEFHTFTLQEERLLRVVLRGVPQGVTEKEVEEDLARQGYQPTTVHRMTNRRTKNPMPLLLIQVPTDQVSILNITRCCDLVVKAEKQKTAPVATQCYRCQRFGHGQSRCTAKPRCVKCGEEHETRTCEKNNDTPAKCANCAGEHPASYRGCGSFPKQGAHKQAAGKPAAKPTAPQPTQPTPLSHPAPAAPGTSYAAAAKLPRAPTGAPVADPTPLAGMGPVNWIAQLSRAQAMFAQLTQLMAEIRPFFQINE